MAKICRPDIAAVSLTDIAVNLTDGMFKGIYNGKQVHPPDIPAVLGRAWDAGVKKIIEFDESGDPDRHMQQLTELAKEGAARGKVVAVGECGLDYDRLQFCPKETQRRYFEKQFDLAEQLKLPMFLHMRAAADDFVDIVQRNKHRFIAGVSHSFTGSTDDLQKLLSINNLYVGINGCSLKTEENLDVMAAVPLERMMIETDSPYCEIRPTHAGYRYISTTWPSKKKEKHDIGCIVKNRNEPCQVRQVLEVVAGHRQLKDLSALSAILDRTTTKVFFPKDVSVVKDEVASGDQQGD
ncbi:hypothetical protein CBR_g41666 [Chara braunii]|uniref:TatD related DNase n=1 Tax=Chara braunii TaxID=69332 RepID=A0A388LWL1_CHABU|nr:hypothetical protein CBR_g41666 [Chara braunii]|eukprot:GBG86602.1 hypothetical protein CBR_g41666 [Chara braunii]